MDDFTFWNFIAGPLGCSFGIIKDKGHLFSDENFQELSSDALKKYNELSNSQEKKMDPDLRDEKAIIDKFASKFNFLTDIKTEPTIYR